MPHSNFLSHSQFPHFLALAVGAISLIAAPRPAGAAPSSLEGRYTADSDVILPENAHACPFRALTFTGDGNFSANLQSDGRPLPAFAGTPASGRYVLRAPGSGAPSELSLELDGGASYRYPFVAFVEGAFEIETPEGACIYFPNPSGGLALSPLGVPWIDACDAACPGMGRLVSCSVPPLAAASDHLLLPIQNCVPLSHAGPALTGPGAEALAAQIIGAFASKPEEDDPFDGAVLRELRLDADGVYALTYVDGGTDAGNWGLDISSGTSGRLNLTSTRGSYGDFSMFIEVLGPDVLEISAIPNRTRIYRLP